MIHIADTGLLKAALDRADEHHDWGKAQLEAHAPFHVCEPVLDELAFLLGAGAYGLRLVQAGDLVLHSAIKDHVPELLALLTKYADTGMDLADACVVRMAEASRHSKVWTVDRRDFQVYKRNGSDVIPCIFP
jgi:predicted nucleic acid-binding protein